MTEDKLHVDDKQSLGDAIEPRSTATSGTYVGRFAKTPSSLEQRVKALESRISGLIATAGESERKIAANEIVIKFLVRRLNMHQAGGLRAVYKADVAPLVAGSGLENEVETIITDALKDS